MLIWVVNLNISPKCYQNNREYFENEIRSSIMVPKDFFEKSVFAFFLMEGNDRKFGSVLISQFSQNREISLLSSCRSHCTLQHKRVNSFY